MWGDDCRRGRWQRVPTEAGCCWIRTFAPTDDASSVISAAYVRLIVGHLSRGHHSKARTRAEGLIGSRLGLLVATTGDIEPDRFETATD